LVKVKIVEKEISYVHWQLHAFYFQK